MAKAARTGRNDPCPYGSGRKFKKCCADAAAPAASETHTGQRRGSGFALVVETPDGPMVRRVADASPLAPDVEPGHAAEDATYNSAAVWGLPDFVFRAALRKTNSGVRELGDGLMLVGDVGVVVQVKHRREPTEDAEKETRWVAKQYAKALRQAEGTVRQLGLKGAMLPNARGREILVEADGKRWLAVIIVDHPDPDDAMLVGAAVGKLPHVVLLRRDWEFLFEQLKSPTAVVGYLERVAGEEVQLGEEPMRYYDRAAADAAATPQPVQPELMIPGARTRSAPLLPYAPAATEDADSHALFRWMLEEIAEAPLPDGDERVRLRVLGELDFLPVGQRDELGRTLRRYQAEARQAPAGESLMRVRNSFSADGRWYTLFCVCSREATRAKPELEELLMLRHHQHYQRLGDAEPQQTTVAVMLTPRHDSVRPWDTSVMMVAGDLGLDPVDLARAKRRWDTGADRARRAA